MEPTDGRAQRARTGTHRSSRGGRRRWRRRAVAACAVLALPVALAHGAAGDLDPTFNDDGRQIISYGSGLDEGRAVLVQPDGKILVVGDGSPDKDFAVTRLNADGTFDPKFGDGGTAFADFGDFDVVAGAALQPDGKIVVGGFTFIEGQQHMAVARFTAQGALDPTFAPGGPDGDGRRVFDDRTQVAANSVLVDRDGTIVLVGQGDVSDTTDVATTRLSAAGAPIGGARELDLGGEEVSAVGSLQSDGKILLAVHSFFSESRMSELVAARLRPDGSLDPTFAGTGKRTVDRNEQILATSVIQAPGGKIVVTGTGGGGVDFVVARLTADGQFDKGFAGDGLFKVDFGGSEVPTAVAVQSDGKLVVSGFALDAGEIDFAVARIRPEGGLDSTFGSDGKRELHFGAADRGFAMALQRDGRILLVGSTDLAGNIVVARLQSSSQTPKPLAPLEEPTSPSAPAPLIGEPGTQTLRCAGRPATIVGTSGRDTLVGTPEADVIVARGGDDVIRAAQGDDLVCGGAGSDVLSGASGDDTLSGNAGQDRLVGAAGRDRLLGGAGRDRLDGGAGRNSCRGGVGRDRVRCGTRGVRFD